jgi:predicted membrane GTPase involved in stress response
MDNENLFSVRAIRQKIDAVLKDEFLEESIRKEDLRIEVINSTEYLGLGAKVGRMISNIGGKVVSVGTEDGIIDQCQIRANKELSKSITVFRIKNEYDCVIAPASQETQADIVVVVGNKYLNRLTK